MEGWTLLLGILFLIVCVLLIIIILLQKGRGGGLGAAFGGGGQSAFGTRTGDVFTWVTIVLTGLFLLLAIGTTVAVRPEQKPLFPPQITPTAAAAIPGVDGKITVNISATEKGSELWYTTNGQDPVPNKEGTSKFGMVPVQVLPGTTVKAVAVRLGRTSQVTEVHYPTEEERATAEAERAAALQKLLEDNQQAQPSTGPEGESTPPATEPETTEPATLTDPPTGAAMAGDPDPEWGTPSAEPESTEAESEEAEALEPAEIE